MSAHGQPHYFLPTDADKEYPMIWMPKTGFLPAFNMEKQLKLKSKVEEPLTEWLNNNLDDPFPTEVEMTNLAKGMSWTTAQVADWLWSERARRGLRNNKNDKKKRNNTADYVKTAKRRRTVRRTKFNFKGKKVFYTDQSIKNGKYNRENRVVMGRRPKPMTKANRSKQAEKHLETWRKVHENESYPTAADILILSQQTEMSTNAIKTYFKFARRRLRDQKILETPSSECDSDDYANDEADAEEIYSDSYSDDDGIDSDDFKADSNEGWPKSDYTSTSSDDNLGYSSSSDEDVDGQEEFNAFGRPRQKWVRVKTSRNKKKPSVSPRNRDTSDDDDNSDNDEDKEDDDNSDNDKVIDHPELRRWFENHKENPHPNKGDLIMMAMVTQKRISEVETWIRNARRKQKKENQLLNL